jgi:Flp pilus assembly protein TadG
MRVRRRRAGRDERGAVLLLTTLALLFIVIPMVGLAIDGGTLYAVKAKLQTATDGAALAAARSLSRGLSLSSQQSSARAMAERFFHANLPDGWLGLRNASIDVTFPPAPPKTTRVHVEARVDAPTYFMGLWRQGPVVVSADGESSRRDVNLLMVMDRSGSLENAGACDDLREAAKTFAQSFVDGRDRLGLITYGTTYRVDFPADFDFQSRSGSNVVSMIEALRCVGGTNSASAYWLAWQQILALNEPGTLNVIVFFTDGQPNALHMPALQIKATSSCANKADKNGVITPAGTQVWGILVPNETSPPPAPNPDWRDISGSGGCQYHNSPSSSFRFVPSDVVALTKPGAANEVDTFGNVLTGYKPVSRDGSGRIRIDDYVTITNAAINALDSAASRVRSLSAGNGLDVMTYTIGLGGASQPAEDALLNRIANTESSAIYDSSKPTGMYVYAANASQLNQAFASIASDILRLSR